MTISSRKFVLRIRRRRDGFLKLVGQLCRSLSGYAQFDFQLAHSRLVHGEYGNHFGETRGFLFCLTKFVNQMSGFGSKGIHEYTTGLGP